jgi:hypothetical protein
VQKGQFLIMWIAFVGRFHSRTFIFIWINQNSPLNFSLIYIIKYCIALICDGLFISIWLEIHFHETADGLGRLLLNPCFTNNILNDIHLCNSFLRLINNLSIIGMAIVDTCIPNSNIHVWLRSLHSARGKLGEGVRPFQFLPEYSACF